MNKIIITFLFLVGITASSCTTSKSVVSQNVDLSKYEYASIINNDTYHIPAQLMEYEIQLFDAVEGSRLKLINDMRINELTATQQSKLLMVKYGVDVLEEKIHCNCKFHRLPHRPPDSFMSRCIHHLRIQRIRRHQKCYKTRCQTNCRNISLVITP